jgi:hypothetical protein
MNMTRTKTRVMNWTGLRKAETRQMMSVKDTAGHYKNVLLFPGEYLRDVDFFLKAGIIGINTRILAVEKDKKLAAKIERGLKKRGFRRFLVHPKELFSLDPTDFLQGEKFDMGFIDLCGNYHAQESFWVYENQHHFAEGAVIGVTCFVKNRRAEFVRAFHKTNNCLLPETIDAINGSVNNLAVYYETLPEPMPTSKYDVKFRTPVTHQMKVNSRINTEASCKRTCQTIIMSMCHKDVDMTHILRYNDGKSDMVFYRMVVKTQQSENMESMFLSSLIKYNGSVSSYNSRVHQLDEPKQRKSYKRSRRTDGTRNIRLCLADKLKIDSRRKLQWPSVQKKIAEIAAQRGVAPHKIEGGISKTLTHREL